MENEKEILEPEKQLETPEEFEKEIMKLTEDDDVEGVEHLLMHRDEHEHGKMADEDDIWQWLRMRMENKLGRKPMLELNEEGMIVPIESKEEK